MTAHFQDNFGSWCEEQLKNSNVLIEIKNDLPNNPYNLIVESIWRHTLDKPAGLEITEMELVPRDQEVAQ